LHERTWFRWAPYIFADCITLTWKVFSKLSCRFATRASCETLKTRVKLYLNFTWPHAITYTNCTLLSSITIINYFFVLNKNNWRIIRTKSKFWNFPSLSHCHHPTHSWRSRTTCNQPAFLFTVYRSRRSLP
jgi:hypothetical protein